MNAARLAAALGLNPSETARLLAASPNSTIELDVNDIDRRYRDAIKAGATPIHAPRDKAQRRAAAVELGSVRINLISQHV